MEEGEPLSIHHRRSGNRCNPTSWKQRFPNSRRLRLTVPSPLVLVPKCRLWFAICTCGNQLDQTAWKQQVISWCFAGNAPNVVVAGAGQKVTGVGQWPCMSLPVPVAGAKAGATFPWGSRASLSAVKTFAFISQERGLPCHLHYGEEPRLIHMQAAKPKGFQGMGVFTITQSHTGKCLAQNGISAFRAEARPGICDVCHKKSN